jgi:isopentenyl phosphate kinase
LQIPTVLKLGGSVITYKNDVRLRVRRTRLAALAAQLAAVPPARRPLALVHGAGSFGHQIVARTRIHKRVKTASHRLAWAETQILQNELDAAVCRALVAAGLPAVPCQPSATARMQGGRLQAIDLRAVQALVAQGLLPVLYGVPAVDEQGGCGILSGDQLAPVLAAALKAPLVLHGTDVDGVYASAAPPAADARGAPRRAVVLAHIDRRTWPQVKKALRGSRSTDVTGGMAAKVGNLMDWAQKGISARIFNATRPDALRRALMGEPLGTAVRWQ